MIERLRTFIVPAGGGSSIAGPVGGPTLAVRSPCSRTSSRREGPPLHAHTREDEMWWILEGQSRFRADDELREAAPGSFVFVPRGVRHCFQNIGDGPVGSS